MSHFIHGLPVCDEPITFRQDWTPGGPQLSIMTPWFSPTLISENVVLSAGDQWVQYDRESREVTFALTNASATYRLCQWFPFDHVWRAELVRGTTPPDVWANWLLKRDEPYLTDEPERRTVVVERRETNGKRARRGSPVRNPAARRTQAAHAVGIRDGQHGSRGLGPRCARA